MNRRYSQLRTKLREQRSDGELVTQGDTIEAELCEWASYSTVRDIDIEILDVLVHEPEENSSA